jgi:hypothetical protein
MTTQEIKQNAIYVINKVITLKYNVGNGCYSDRAELAKQEARLEAIKNWAIENNMLQDIKHYLGSKNWGMGVHFYATEVHKYFCN